MARHGSANTIAIRHERGHYLNGMPGGPRSATRIALVLRPQEPACR
jgi:hypothetical protein